MIQVPLPYEMFPGIDVSQYKHAKALLVNPVETIAALLLRNDVVGDDCSNFKWDYCRQHNENGEELIGDHTSSEFFRKAEEAVRLAHGDGVSVLSIIVSTDKTDEGDAHIQFLKYHILIIHCYIQNTTQHILFGTLTYIFYCITY